MCLSRFKAAQTPPGELSMPGDLPEIPQLSQGPPPDHPQGLMDNPALVPKKHHVWPFLWGKSGK